VTPINLEPLLRRHRHALEACGDDRAFLTAYRGLIADVAALVEIDDDQLERAIDVHAGFFRSMQQRYLAVEERDAAEGLLTSSSSSTHADGRAWTAFADEAYRRVADLEQVGSFGDFRRVVAAGSGALPSTLLWMADHFPGASYVGLDVDERCIDVASRVAKQLELTNVTFVQTDAAAYDYAGVDFVFVANQVRPKVGVLERIAATIGHPVTVVVREPTAVGRLFAEPVDVLPPGYRVEHVGDASRAFLSRDVFLTLG
jgi:hypothetical protein